MKIGYAHEAPGSDGRSLPAQREALRAAGCEITYEDRTPDEKGQRRPSLDNLLARLGKGDVLVAWSIGALARSHPALVRALEAVARAGAELRLLREDIDTSSDHGRVALRLAAAVAAHYRTSISTQIRAGIAAATLDGRPPGPAPRLTGAQASRIRELVESGAATHGDAALLLGVHEATIGRALRRLKKRDGARPDSPDENGKRRAGRRPLLSAAQTARARAMMANGKKSRREIAAELGVSAQTLWRALAREEREGEDA